MTVVTLAMGQGDFDSADPDGNHDEGNSDEFSSSSDGNDDVE